MTRIFELTNGNPLYIPSAEDSDSIHFAKSSESIAHLTGPQQDAIDQILGKDTVLPETLLGANHPAREWNTRAPASPAQTHKPHATTPEEIDTEILADIDRTFGRESYVGQQLGSAIEARGNALKALQRNEREAAAPLMKEQKRILTDLARIAAKNPDLEAFFRSRPEILQSAGIKFDPAPHQPWDASTGYAPK